MFDTLTLLVVTILQFKIIGIALLIAWFFLRRVQPALKWSGTSLIIATLCLLVTWYFWERGHIEIGHLNPGFMSALIFIPSALIIYLLIRLMRSEALLHLIHNKRVNRTRTTIPLIMEAESFGEELREAMLQHSEALYLIYQPIYLLKEHTLVGFEAQVRWDHPRRGTIAPMELILVAEQRDLIVLLGTWALETACVQAVQWPKAWYVSVKLSLFQLEKISLLSTVRSILNRNDFPINRLNLEIEESTLVLAENSCLVRLGELQRQGIKITISEFGTGYSSLAFLRQLPFDNLKVDNSFIQDVSTNPSSQAIVGSIAELARRLDREVIVDCVDSLEQLTMLDTLNCQYVQGKLWGKPMLAEEIMEFKEL